MPELTTADVTAYTGGRLDSNDQETERLLAASLSAARRYCRWHVTPEKTADELTIDGPGGALLVLPTLRLTAVTALTEDGEDLDVDTLGWSTRGLISKPGKRLWTSSYQGVTATITHGFDSAPDWESAILEMVSRMSMAPLNAELSLGGSLSGKRVDDVSYNWQPFKSSATLFDGSVAFLLDSYKLEPSA
jgi:hypothetical protein